MIVSTTFGWSIRRGLGAMLTMSLELDYSCLITCFDKNFEKASRIRRCIYKILIEFLATGLDLVRLVVRGERRYAYTCPPDTNETYTQWVPVQSRFHCFVDLETN